MLHFWRLAIKPGRPVALGQIGAVPLIGLPGNPVAVVVTFAVLARPLILKLAGAAASAPRLFPVRAGFAYRKKPGRREYLRARLERDGDSGRRRQTPPRRRRHPILDRAVGRPRHPRRGDQRPRGRHNRRFSAVRRGDRVKLLYFAWLRARIGCAEEEVALPHEVHDVAELLDWLRSRGGGLCRGPAEPRDRARRRQSGLCRDGPPGAGRRRSRDLSAGHRRLRR